MLVEDLHPSSLECPHEVFCGCVLNRQRHAVVRYCGWIIVDYFHLHLWLKALPAGAGVFAQGAKVHPVHGTICRCLLLLRDEWWPPAPCPESNLQDPAGLYQRRARKEKLNTIRIARKHLGWRPLLLGWRR